MVTKTKTPAIGPLDGEDLETEHWEDARHWMSIYSDLIQFKVGVLDRVRHELSKLPPVARDVASEDIGFIEAQMEGYQARLTLWSRRLWDLQGLVIDPHDRSIQYQGKEIALTHREAELLQFLLDHPHRFYTVEQITTFAWSDRALLPEEVRNYVSRIRRIFARLDVPCDLTNRPGQGYALTFRPVDG